MIRRWLTSLFKPDPNDPAGYKYHAWIPDGSGRTLHTNDERAAELAKDGLHVRADGKVACITCGGNCGQCGMTQRLGNIGFSLQTIVDSLHDRRDLITKPKGDRK